jgi:hypothetical protein
MSKSKEFGPIYGVELLDVLPISERSGRMFQALPSRADLEKVGHSCTRAAAGYEVLLAHYREEKRKLAAAREALQTISLIIEQNNEQNGFWGVAGAHGALRQAAIDGLEKSK